MPTYANGIHLPQDNVKGFFVSLQDAHRLLGKTVFVFPTINQSQKIIPIKPVNTNHCKKFSISDFGICEKVDLGIQSNKAGKILLRSEAVAIATSQMSNPLKHPLTVIYCKSLKRYFLKDGFHRLFECVRRGYRGIVYANIVSGNIYDCPNTSFPCVALKHIEYYDDVL